jgi:uncharacterized protein
MPHPNEDLIRRATEALNAGDVETFLGFHTDDVAVHVTGRHPYSGDFNGKGEVGELFQRQAQELDGPPQFELHDVVANDRHGIILGTQRTSRGGRTLDARTAVVLHLADGKATEVWVLSTDPYAEDEFYGAS